MRIRSYSFEKEIEMLRFTLLILTTAFYSLSAKAAYSPNVKEAIDVIVLFCVAGGQESKVSVDARLDGGLSVRKTGVTGGAGISISQSQAKGLVEGLRGEMNKITGVQATEARQCMKPYIDRIVNTLLDQPKSTTVPDKNTDTQRPSTPGVVKQSSSVHMKGYAFESKGCSQAGSNVTCKVAITNTGEEDKSLIIGGDGNMGKPSSLYDESGNEFRPTSLRIGTTKDRLYIGYTFSPSLPTIVIFTFEKISTRFTGGSFRLGVAETVQAGSFGIGANSWFHPVLRNISFSN